MNLQDGGLNMAGRPIKQGIDYFPLDTGFFSDVKIRKIARACGPNAASVIICLLCNIYRNNGYYILWDEDLPFFIADEVGVSEGCVKEVLLKAVQVGFFDVDKHSAYGILTSSGIQKRFFEITKRRTETELIPEYLINVDINSINARKNSINVHSNGQSKVKIKRNKEISLSRDKEIPQLEKDIKMPLDECHAYILKNYSQWVETVTMNIRSSGFPDFTMDSFKDYLRRFFEKLKNEGEDGKSPSDAQSHFYRWLVIQLGNAPKNAYLAENNRLLEWLPDGMYKRFVGMVHDFAPYCFANMKMPSEEEVDGFKHMFESTKTIREALMQVENNTELRRKREYLGQTIRDQLAITKKINT